MHNSLYNNSMSNLLNSLEVKAGEQNIFPYMLPLFKNGLKIKFTKPITFIIGENGSGKSTLLEGIAGSIGFNIHGGNRNNIYSVGFERQPELSKTIKLSWNLKTNQGFFFRAESFYDFANHLIEKSKEDALAFTPYGGKSLNDQSHGESFLSVFSNRFAGDGLYILDEPEAALSPERQMSLISLINDLVTNTNAQFIISTHSPILITSPNAQILEIEDGKLFEKHYADTKQFNLYKSFINCPEKYLKYLVED